MEHQREKKCKQLEAITIELERLNEQKSIFMGTVAHDLKKPLGVVSAYAQLLASDKIPNLDTLAMGERIGTAVNRMVTLIDSYLNEASIEEGVLKLDIKPVPISQFLEGRMDFLQSLASLKEIQIETRIDQGSEIFVDELRIEQVLDNLVGNAIKLSPHGSTIDLNLADNETTIVLSVRDRGPGIPDELMNELFHPFVVGKAIPTGDEKCVGLGLAIVKRIVDAHGGNISAESVLSGGALFSVTFPKSGLTQ